MTKILLISLLQKINKYLLINSILKILLIMLNNYNHIINNWIISKDIQNIFIQIITMVRQII